MIDPSRSGRGGCCPLRLVDLIRDGVEGDRAFDGVLPPLKNRGRFHYFRLVKGSSRPPSLVARGCQPKTLPDRVAGVATRAAPGRHISRTGLR